MQKSYAHSIAKKHLAHPLKYGGRLHYFVDVNCGVAML
jgi:hypothetical protein